MAVLWLNECPAVHWLNECPAVLCLNGLGWTNLSCDGWILAQLLGTFMARFAFRGMFGVAVICIMRHCNGQLVWGSVLPPGGGIDPPSNVLAGVILGQLWAVWLPFFARRCNHDGKMTVNLKIFNFNGIILRNLLRHERFCGIILRRDSAERRQILRR